MKKTVILLAIFVFSTTLVFADVIISEMCDPHLNYSNDRFIEICNTGDVSVDLTGWSVVAVGNGSDILTWNLSGTIAAGDALVCGDATTTAVFDVDFPDEAWSESNSTWNGKSGDGAKLYDNSKALVDNAVVNATAFENKTYVRNSDILIPNTTYTASEWTATAVENATDATPGSHTFGGAPEIAKAYAISETAVDVLYSADITSVDPADYSLTGTATITFSSATIDATNPKLVHLTGASADMIGDVTLDNIADAANSTNYDFYAGITPIALTNTLNPDGHIDNEHLATFKGIVSANDAYNNVWVSDAEGAYNGVLIYDYNFDSEVAVGDEILFTANRTEYNNLTELENPTLLEIISTDNTPYGPTDIAGSDINETLTANTNPAEKWEGQLVRIQNFYVESYTDYDYRCRWSDGGTDYYFHVGDNVDYQFGSFSLILGETYLEIIGVVDWDNSGSYYRINPRDINDQTLPVTLVSFTATYTSEYANGCVKIAWQTASESDVIGFNIYRNTENNYQDARPVNSDLIYPQGSTSQGAEYSLYDIGADVLTSYNYWLEVVNNGAPADVYGPITYQSIDIDGNGEQNIIYTKLESCYPNPVQAGHPITFSFTLGGLEGTSSHVELKVYNLLGELVDVVEDGERAVQDYTVSWTPTNLANGIYFYQLKTDTFNEVKKFVVVQ